MTRKFYLGSKIISVRLLFCLSIFLCLLSDVSFATPPLTPWQDLENRVETEGISSVRAAYRARIDELLENLGDTPPKDTAEFWQQTMMINELLEYTNSWVGVEGRDKPGAAKVDNYNKIIHASRRAVQALAQLKASAPSIEAGQSEDVLRRYGPIVQNVGSLDGNQQVLGLRVASLALVAGSDKLLDETFNVFGDGVISGEQKFRNPAEFERNPPDVNKILGIRPTPHEKQADTTLSTPAISDEERAQARAVIEETLTALVDGSESRLVAAYYDEEKARAHSRAISDSPIKLLEYDLSGARFDFKRTGASEISVTVSGIAMTADDNGNLHTSQGRQVYLVDFSTGRALIKGKGK